MYYVKPDVKTPGVITPHPVFLISSKLIPQPNREKYHIELPVRRFGISDTRYQRPGLPILSSIVQKLLHNII